MKLRSYRSANYYHQTVLYRAAYDIALAKKGRTWAVSDDTRLRETIPSLRWLRKRADKIVILSWLGRPKRAGDPGLRMDPIARRLQRLLNVPVRKLDACVGPLVEKTRKKAPAKSIFLLENVRFYKGEESNDPTFSRLLARNADLIVNDAFAQCHRKVASIVGIQRQLDSFAGPLLEREVRQLGQILHSPRRPLVAVLGGGKISSESKLGGQRVPVKIRLIISLLRHVDYLLLGGVLANIVLEAKGLKIGKSISDPSLQPVLRKISLTNKKLRIPIDVVTSLNPAGTKGYFRRAVGNIRSSEHILDIGPDTVALFAAIIKKAKMVIWNGPLGYTENQKFAYGTRSIAGYVARSKAISIVGGGDTLAALHRAKLLQRMTYASTAGGAMLEFLEQGTLPGIEPLRIN